MEYEHLFEALWKERVHFLICGGLAVNIYGIPRMTADIDLLLDFEKDNLDRFDQVLKKLSYSPVAPIPVSQLSDKVKRMELIKEKHMIAYSFYNSRSNYMSVDVLLDPPATFESMWEKRETRKIDDYEVTLVSLPHLIEMKTFANRKQDQDDVILLSKLMNKK